MIKTYLTYLGIILLADYIAYLNYLNTYNPFHELLIWGLTGGGVVVFILLMTAIIKAEHKEMKGDNDV